MEDTSIISHKKFSGKLDLSKNSTRVKIIIVAIILIFLIILAVKFNSKSPLEEDEKRITPEEWNAAITYLEAYYPPETWQQLQNLTQCDGWWIKYHHGFGTEVRNTLRKGGFDWGSISLDDNWASLMEDALERWEKKNYNLTQNEVKTW